MELANKRVLVIGLGKTGIAVARFLAGVGARVLVTDAKAPEELRDALSIIAGLKTPVVRPYDISSLNGIDLVVPSPGVPPSDRILAAALERGIPILSEIELAFRFLRPPMVAITGTNGKTTTTSLIGHIFEKAGKKVFVGGNIGNPLIEYVAGPQEEDFAVVEISSFQLQWTDLFRPAVSILLNTTTDHIDYHGSFEDYRAAKERIFENQGRGDLAILNADDPFSASLIGKFSSEMRFFSLSPKIGKGIFFDGTNIRFWNSSGEEIYPGRLIRLPGMHNIENIMAAIVAARWSNCPCESVLSAVGDFRGIPHRIEFAGEKDGVAFYDDSKATNVGAVMRALESFTRPVILLLGGRDKGGDFQSLSGLLRKRAKKIILFGEARDLIESMLINVVDTAKAATLGEAVAAAWKSAASGDVVLLSPGCASFDEFANYAERGKFFKDLVQKSDGESCWEREGLI